MRGGFHSHVPVFDQRIYFTCIRHKVPLPITKCRPAVNSATLLSTSHKQTHKLLNILYMCTRSLYASRSADVHKSRVYCAFKTNCTKNRAAYVETESQMPNDLLLNCRHCMADHNIYTHRIHVRSRTPAHIKYTTILNGVRFGCISTVYVVIVYVNHRGKWRA